MHILADKNGFIYNKLSEKIGIVSKGFIGTMEVAIDNGYDIP